MTLAQRAADRLAWRIGATHYADTSEPKSSVLKEAEMHLAMEQMLLSAAAIADNAAGASVPFAGDGAALRVAAEGRRRRAEPLLMPYDTAFGRPRWRRPQARAGTAMEATLPIFDPGE